MKTTNVKTTKITGIMNYEFVDKKEFSVSDAEDLIMSIGKATGINKSSGEGAEFMDNTKLENFSFNDLTNKNGIHQGYTTSTKGNDKLLTKWQGNIKTSLSEEGKPIVSFDGNFVWMKGTGPFKKLENKGGTYHGHFTSENAYVVDWEGEL